ncbi:MAG: hypothetical protein Q9171_003192 [Xanthocarpia ochracea]
MARGIKKSPRGTPETDILTWDGGRGRAGRRAAGRRRKDAGCGGGLKCPPGWNCDEWPPASTLEGGAGSVITCDPKELNDWQGTYFGSWLAEAKSRGFKSGDQFRVKLKFFDLDSVQKRELFRRAIPIPSHDNNEYGYIGKYSVDYGITGGALSSASIMDDTGEPYEVRWSGHCLAAGLDKGSEPESYLFCVCAACTHVFYSRLYMGELDGRVCRGADGSAFE